MQVNARAARGLVVRRAQIDDAVQVADVLLASRRAFLPYAVSPHSEAEIRAWVRDFVFANEEVFAALMDGLVVGMMSIRRSAIDDPTFDGLNQMYVHPAHVNQGIGSALLAMALKNVRDALRLFTFQQNTAARRFYERHGFKAIAFSDGRVNEERCPDVLYEFNARCLRIELSKAPT